MEHATSWNAGRMNCLRYTATYRHLLPMLSCHRNCEERDSGPACELGLWLAHWHDHDCQCMALISMLDICLHHSASAYCSSYSLHQHHFMITFCLQVIHAHLEQAAYGAQVVASQDDSQMIYREPASAFQVPVDEPGWKHHSWEPGHDMPAILPGEKQTDADQQWLLQRSYEGADGERVTATTSHILQDISSTMQNPDEDEAHEAWQCRPGGPRTQTYAQRML